MSDGATTSDISKTMKGVSIKDIPWGSGLDPNKDEAQTIIAREIS